MPFLQIVQMIAALAVTLGIFGLGVWGLRRYGPTVMKRMAAVNASRRMAVIETLMLDQKSRLVLIRIDEEERLVLIGPGQVIERKKGLRP
jgi:flagellar protein FliO/FliZ